MDEDLKELWEIGKEFTLSKVDYELPVYKKLITEQKFKLIYPEHPENFGSKYSWVDYDGFKYISLSLPALAWYSEFEVRDDDVITASYPKTGTTWVQEIVWLLTHDFDYDTAKKVDLNDRSPIMEISGAARPFIDKQKFPRQYHFHTPYRHIPAAIRDRKIKLIYVTRNPKDCCVSLFHFYQFMDWFKYKGDIKEFARMFMEDEVLWAPVEKHILEFWNHRNDGHILFVTYEELKKDPFGGIRKIAAFLEKPVTEEQVAQLVEHTSFNSMAKLKTVNREEFFSAIGVKDDTQKFMRKGIIGDWKNAFDEETNQKFDKWIEERFGNSDLKFDFE